MAQLKLGRRDGVTGIVKGLRVGQSGMQITVGESDFSFLGKVHTASCPIGTVLLSREKSRRPSSLPLGFL